MFVLQKDTCENKLLLLALGVQIVSDHINPGFLEVQISLPDSIKLC